MIQPSRAKRIAVASLKQRKLLTFNPWGIFEVILISLYILHIMNLWLKAVHNDDDVGTDAQSLLLSP